MLNKLKQQRGAQVYSTNLDLQSSNKPLFFLFFLTSEIRLRSRNL